MYKSPFTNYGFVFQIEMSPESISSLTDPNFEMFDAKDWSRLETNLHNVIKLIYVNCNCR